MKYLSPLLSDARASIGGATASKNRAGNYFRERIAPVQPRTPAQQAIRAGLATLSAQWRALTASQIAAWNALATQVVKKDSLGNSYTLTGEQLYVGNNQSLTLNSQANVSTPPASPPSFPGPMLLAAAASAGGATSIAASSRPQPDMSSRSAPRRNSARESASSVPPATASSTASRTARSRRSTSTPRTSPSSAHSRSAQPSASASLWSKSQPGSRAWSQIWSSKSLCSLAITPRR